MPDIKEANIEAFYELESRFYSEQRDKPLEIKAAIIWGALIILCNTKSVTWDSARLMFGEFMSKQMELR